MTKEREALKLALEALENNRQTHHYCEDTWYSCPKHEDGCANEAEGDECNCGADKANAEIDYVTTAIKEVLAQPEQEPVQWGVDWGRAGETPCVSIIKRKPNGGIEVVAVEYGQPAQRNPLTDEDVNKLVDDEDWYNDPHGFVRAIEAAHGIKGEA